MCVCVRVCLTELEGKEGEGGREVVLGDLPMRAGHLSREGQVSRPFFLTWGTCYTVTVFPQKEDLTGK